MFDQGHIAGLPTERLEAEICTLAGHLAAATNQWLLLVAEFDAREGWRAWEQLSCAGWLSWKCGMSLTTAHEHIRVARALATLPATRDAFAAGTISYSKARAITRVARPDNEDGWVACALGCTAAQLDRLALACRKVGRAQSEDRANREKLSWRHDDDGMLVISARLAPEHGARVVAALEQLQRAAAETPPDTANNTEARATESSAEDDEPAAEKGPRRPASPQPGETAAAEHHRKHRREHDRREHGAKATDENHARPGCTRPEALVAMADQVLAHGRRPVDTGDLHHVIIHADQPALTGASGRCHLHDGPSLHPETLRRLICEGGAADTVRHTSDGTPLDVGRTTRTVPARLRRAVIDRAGGRCQYPGCTHKAWLQLHHVIHWIDGGPTNYANLCLLCPRHHRAHHAGTFQITQDPQLPGHFRFRLADGTDVDHAPHLPPPAGDIADHHHAYITADTIHPAWHGEPLNLDYAVLVMAQ